MVHNCVKSATPLTATSPEIQQYRTAKGLTGDDQGPAVDLLCSLGIQSQADSAPVPTLDEIDKEIASGKPLIACVGTRRPQHGGRQLSYANGHWVVIMGCDTTNGTIDVADPNPQVTNPNTVAYNNSTYMSVGGVALYWENTSYV